MKSIAIVMVFIFAGLTASSVQAEIYSWTDENGVKHYSHTPPTDRSVRIKTAPEIRPGQTTDQKTEKISEENIDAILDELDKEEPASTPKPAKTQKPLSRRERIQAEREKLAARLHQFPQQTGHHRALSVSVRSAVVQSGWIFREVWVLDFRRKGVRCQVFGHS